MKSTLLALFIAVLLALNFNAVSQNKEKAAINTLTEKEAKTGWILLFDGKTNEGWRSYNKTTFPSDWNIEDGAIHLKGSGNGEAGSVNGGDLVYGRKFANFHLKIEWKISEGGNSGIFYLAQEIPGKEIWRTAPEFQVLDNDRHPDAMLGKDGNRQAGSLYDLLPANPQNTKPAGEWNSAEILSYQGTIIHFQNGEKILEYHLWTPEWNALVAGSKFPTYNPDWAKVAKEGFIGLQDHGNDVWYRNIKIQVK
jgi:Domain of Unknown Function (DUF1080)